MSHTLMSYILEWVILLKFIVMILIFFSIIMHHSVLFLIQFPDKKTPIKERILSRFTWITFYYYLLRILGVIRRRTVLYIQCTYIKHTQIILLQIIYITASTCSSFFQLIKPAIIYNNNNIFFLLIIFINFGVFFSPSSHTTTSG